MPDSLNPRQRQILDLPSRSQPRSLVSTDRPGDRSSGRPQLVVDRAEPPQHARDARVHHPRPGEVADRRDRRRPVQSRGAGNIVHLPLVGRVAAGTPVLAVENVEEHLNVGTEIAGGDDSYALTVHGESMIDAGIRDGDIVVVQPAAGRSGQRHHRRRPHRERAHRRERGDRQALLPRSRDGSACSPRTAPWSRSTHASCNLEGVVVAVIRLLK